MAVCGTQPPACSLTPGVVPPGIDPACRTDLDCIYCVAVEDQVPCTIEQDGCQPCGTHETLARHFFPPGFVITPDKILPYDSRYGFRGTPDLFGDDNQFSAGLPHLDGGNNDGNVRYYLIPFVGAVDSSFPDPSLDGQFSGNNCCMWLCHFTVSYDALRAWTLWCHEVLKLPKPEKARVDFQVQFGKRICHLNFVSRGLTSTCFTLRDQFCYTAGRVDITNPPGDWWAHRSESEPTLVVLDHLQVSYRMRLTNNQALYPVKEPTCRRIASDALLGVETMGLNQLAHTGRAPTTITRHLKYDDPQLNQWSGTAVFGNCATAPAVVNRTPWFVHVRRHGTNCRFPAQLVYRRISVVLQASVERLRWNLGRGSISQNPHRVRVNAMLACQVDLGVRLLAGWENIACDVPIPAGMTPCGLDRDFIDPNSGWIVESDDCSTVPLTVKWYGMLGPAPWSSAGSGYDAVPSCRNVQCFDVIHALDGILIPGEVTNFKNPIESQQLYTGDVVVHVNGAENIGC